MAVPTKQSENTLRLRRTFAAPREKVFQAWTDPAALKQWWCMEGYETPLVEVDLRVGGSYRIGMRKLPDGEVFHVSGTYKEIRPAEKLVYTWWWDNEPDFPETLVTVEFRAQGNSTELWLTHELLSTGKMREEHQKGWNICLDRVGAFLAR